MIIACGYFPFSPLSQTCAMIQNYSGSVASGCSVYDCTRSSKFTISFQTSATLIFLEKIELFHSMERNYVHCQITFFAVHFTVFFAWIVHWNSHFVLQQWNNFWIPGLSLKMFWKRQVACNKQPVQFWAATAQYWRSVYTILEYME